MTQKRTKKGLNLILFDKIYVLPFPLGSFVHCRSSSLNHRSYLEPHLAKKCSRATPLGITMLRRDFFFRQRNGFAASRRRFHRMGFNPRILLSSRSRMKLELLLLPRRSNFFAAIKSANQRKWITLRKIAPRFFFFFCSTKTDESGIETCKY